jgi:hypothetical protein
MNILDRLKSIWVNLSNLRPQLWTPMSSIIFFIFNYMIKNKNQFRINLIVKDKNEKKPINLFFFKILMLKVKKKG